MGFQPRFQNEEGEDLARKDRLLQTTMLVTLVIIFSKAVGFLREMVVAHYFGTQPENDAYEPIIVNEVIILGKVIALLRNY